MTIARLTRRSALGLLAAPTLLTRAAAQITPPPTRSIRALLGWPPGGSSDIVARTFAERMKTSLTAAILVENRPGAGGRIALEAAKSAPPDGSLYIQTPASMLTIYPHLYKSLRYELADFTPVTTICAFPFGLSVRADHPAKTLAEFIAWARGQQQVSWASPSPGTMPHFMGVELARLTNIPMVHVPYRGGAAVLTDVLAGVIAAGMNVLSEPIPFHRSGEVRILAVSAPQRLPRLPAVPTFAEAGFPALTRQEWFGVLLPAGSPEGVVAPLHAALAAAATTTEVTELLSKLEFAPEIMTPAAFTARIKAERESWGPIIAASGYKPEE